MADAKRPRRKRAKQSYTEHLDAENDIIDPEEEQPSEAVVVVPSSSCVSLQPSLEPKQTVLLGRGDVEDAIIAW